jgi:hypothetical protein
MRNLTALDCLDGCFFRYEYSGWTKMAIDVFLIDERGIDRGALDD